jgi:hypothetical protein
MRTVLAFPADTHSGSTVGLMRDKPWQLDTEGTYHPSKTQRLLWRQWVECWDAVKALQADRLIITVMGDCVDGKHHETSELVTARVEEQERIFIDALDWALVNCHFKKESDVLQFISGTPVHTGEMAQSERRICEDMGGRGLFDRLKFEVQGVRFDCAHDGVAVGSRAWTDDNSFKATIRSMLYQSLLNKQEVPNYIIRAHRHRFVPAPVDQGAYRIDGFICPAFQFKTGYGQRFTAMSNDPPNIGMLYVIVEDGKSMWHCPRMHFPKEKYESL